jgi:hypothetical protein
VIVERFKLDLDIARLHDFVNLPVFLATDELAMLIRKLNLETDFMLINLRSQYKKRNNAEQWEYTRLEDIQVH